MYPNCRYSCVCGFKTWTAYENSSRTKRTLSRTAICHCTEDESDRGSLDGEETVLVQGIIDAYFIEDDEIVLVDYKTDKVSPGGEQDLIDLYHIRLEDYAAALERMLQKK